MLNKSRTSKASVYAVVALTFLAVTFMAQANRVDRIDPNQQDHYFLSVDNGTPTANVTVSGIPFPSTYKGRRDVTLDVNGGTGASSFKLAGDSFLELDNDATTSSILNLAYGVGNGNNPDQFGNKFNAISVTVGQVSNGDNGLSLGSGEFTLTLQSGNTVGTSTVPVTFTQAGTYLLSFADPGFAGITFNQIQRVTVNLITTTDGTDFRIDRIDRAVIPEPSTWALFAVGGAGILAMGLRRRSIV